MEAGFGLRVKIPPLDLMLNSSSLCKIKKGSGEKSRINKFGNIS